MSGKDTKGLSAKKSENFSEWYSDVIQKAELADLRYNVKGFIVFQPWAVMTMEHMYRYMENALQRKGHKPYWFPTVIPEGNLTKESEHLKGFTPEVFWITHGGDSKFEERLALRPTSETAFYQMFALWVRSYKQLPFKTYQRANVFRHETKATRPFLRSREFHWIETHCLFPTQEAAFNQVHEDMKTTEEVLHETFGLPFIFFERPRWDTFPGATKTFAADALMPDGKLLQLPSTHMISQEFLRAFNVKFKDNTGKELTPYSTCYGPAISRIFGALVIVHGDDKGLRFPWSVSPVHVAFVPLSEKAEKKAQDLAKKIDARVEVDTRDMSPGEKFNYWELKGIPIRVDIGDKELKEKKVSVFRRDLNKKELILEKDFTSYVKKIMSTYDTNLRKQADSLLEGRIKNVKTMNELKEAIESGAIVRAPFCSIEKEGSACADKITEATGGQVRGKKLDNEKASGNCIICGKKAHEVVYIGRSY